MNTLKIFRLNLRQQRFCEIFVRNGANAVQAYLHAYGIDGSDPKKYQSAKAAASRLLNDQYVRLYARFIFRKDFTNSVNQMRRNGC